MGGVVVNSVTPIGLRDREAGTVTFTTSLGFGRKLERIAADPRIAVAYHTRQHGHTDRPGVVLVQGIASVRAITHDERDHLADHAVRHVGQLATGRFWDWWLAVYYLDRVRVDVMVQRVVWWPTGSLGDESAVFGAAAPEEPAASQLPPRDATTPRLPMAKLRRSIRMPHLLLGFTQFDGMPCIVPVSGSSVDDTGVVIGDNAQLLACGVPRA
jgi:hypothetical protein